MKAVDGDGLAKDVIGHRDAGLGVTGETFMTADGAMDLECAERLPLVAYCLVLEGAFPERDGHKESDRAPARVVVHVKGGPGLGDISDGLSEVPMACGWV